MAYTKLDSGITESTIWHAPDTTLRVWIAMLARADQHGYVGASMPGLAALSRVSLEACIAAVALLEAPDEWSRTKDHEGRRIAPADGGWLLLNHAKYRAKQNADDRRERSRVAMVELRARRKQEQQTLTVSEVNRSDAKLSQAEAEAEALVSDGAKAPSSSAAPTKRRAKMPEIPPPYEAIVAAYREILPELPGLNLDGKTWERRKKSIREFWCWVRTSVRSDGVRRATTAEEAMEWIRSYFQRARASDWIMGRVPRGAGHETWEADLDYLLSEKGKIRVIEKTKDAA